MFGIRFNGWCVHSSITSNMMIIRYVHYEMWEYDKNKLFNWIKIKAKPFIISHLMRKYNGDEHEFHHENFCHKLVLFFSLQLVLLHWEYFIDDGSLVAEAVLQKVNCIRCPMKKEFLDMRPNRFAHFLICVSIENVCMCMCLEEWSKNWSATMARTN